MSELWIDKYDEDTLWFQFLSNAGSSAIHVLEDVNVLKEDVTTLQSTNAELVAENKEARDLLAEIDVYTGRDSVELVCVAGDEETWFQRRDELLSKPTKANQCFTSGEGV